MDVPPFSDTALHLQKLPSAISSDQSSLLSHALLTDILVAGIIRHANQDPQPLLPSYLAEARILFDHHFEENYSLDELAMRFHVSKYRFCREFGTAFGETPLQYLNRKRIKVAKHLLLTTSLKIHEVGSAVGIDNTNHFISLFKKYTDVTCTADIGTAVRKKVLARLQAMMQCGISHADLLSQNICLM